MRAFIVLALVCAVGCGDDGGATVSDAGMADAGSSQPPPEVDAPAGRIRGTRRPGYQEFLGIPYAEPPVGPLRFAPPVAHAPLDGTFDATARPPACVQRAFGLNTGDEDCLFLNVHTPDPRPDHAPVMVWIHGGAFIFGEGVQTDGGTRGDLLASEHGMVVVSMNYRLGPLGFFALPGGPTGNQGIADQVLALAWVRDNIAAFGGDPDDVTLFGESAGGLSVCLHLISAGSDGLFARAISESGLCDSTLPTLAEAEVRGSSLAAAAGCGGADALACMRDATVDAIYDADVGPTGMTALTGDRTWWPNVDADLVPDQLGSLLVAGALTTVPTLVGWNADEGTLFVALAEQAGIVADEAAYHEGLAKLGEDHGIPATEIEARYPLDAYPDPGAALADALGDAMLACPSRRAALALSARTDVRVYRFEYPDAPFQLPSERALGAFHSAEIQYVFGHPATLGRTVHTGDDLALHEIVSGYWTRFAASGDPNGEGAAAWPTFDAASDAALALDLDPHEITGPDAEACAFWDR